MTETGAELERKIEADNRRRSAEESTKRAEALSLAATAIGEVLDDPHRYIDIVTLKEDLADQLGISVEELQERLEKGRDEVENAAQTEQNIANEAASMADAIASSTPPPPPGPPPPDLGHPEIGGGLGILTK